MKRILSSFIFLFLNVFIILSCGKNSRANTSPKNDKTNNYYIVSNVMPPANNPSIYFLSDINEINKNNQSYFLIKIENAHEIKMAISCESIICKFNNTNSSKSEVSGIADLLIKLNFPDKITGLSDKNGYKYTATKLVDEDDIKKLNKIISNNG